MRNAKETAILPFKPEEDRDDEEEKQFDFEFKAYPSKNVGLSKVLARGLT